MIEIVKKGLLTTVQDGGRRGWQHIGVPVCGAMDLFSLAVANILAGNPWDSDALEITGIGPDIVFLSSNIFAVSGGSFDMTLDGQPIEMNRAYLAKKGATLKMGGAEAGFRAYISFCGGLDVPPVLGSRSTCLLAGFGGLDGRALEAGDKIGFRNPQRLLPSMGGRAAQGLILPKKVALRVILGPQDDHFSVKGLDTFLSAEYQVTAESNRMGLRAKGPQIGFAEGFGANIISDGIAFGAIQVPGGQPVIMAADRQTVGGYAKIANVISADLPLLAQCRPGSYISFSAVSVRQAQLAARDSARRLRNLERELNYSATAWKD